LGGIHNRDGEIIFGDGNKLEVRPQNMTQYPKYECIPPAMKFVIQV